MLNISTGKQVKSGSCRVAGAALCMCCESNGRLLWVGDDKVSHLLFMPWKSATFLTLPNLGLRVQLSDGSDVGQVGQGKEVSNRNCFVKLC